KLAGKDDLIHLSGDDLRARLTHKEIEFLKDQDVLAVNCSYLAESLTVVVMFRDAKAGFSEADAATLKAVYLLFAVALAGMRRGEGAAVFRTPLCISRPSRRGSWVGFRRSTRRS